MSAAKHQQVSQSTSRSTTSMTAMASSPPVSAPEPTYATVTITAISRRASRGLIRRPGRHARCWPPGAAARLRAPGPAGAAKASSSGKPGPRAERGVLRDGIGARNSARSASMSPERPVAVSFRGTGPGASHRARPSGNAELRDLVGRPPGGGLGRGDVRRYQPGQLQAAEEREYLGRGQAGVGVRAHLAPLLGVAQRARDAVDGQLVVAAQPRAEQPVVRHVLGQQDGEEADDVRVVVPSADDAGDDVEDAEAGVGAELPELGVLELVAVVKDGVQEFFLRAVVVDHARLRDAGGGRDVAEGGAARAVTGQHAGSDLDDPL